MWFTNCFISKCIKILTKLLTTLLVSFIIKHDNVHEQFNNSSQILHELLMKVYELGGNTFFAKYCTLLSCDH